ncbi:MAG: TolC family protein [Saprospiraceae bacterium]|nr:TolC family protein [Saprospiraceae bacterium]
MKKLRLVIVLLAVCTHLSGQSSDQEEFNFSLDYFLDEVRQNHPVVRQTNLFAAQAEAVLMESRGGFDPKLYSDFKNKNFDDKNYYNVGEGGVKIPTWVGLEVKAAYNWTNGDFLNPEQRLPTAGQAILGFKMPLLQGMRFDERRAGVQEAKIFQQMNEAERQQVMNDLLLAATETYWNWAYTYAVLSVFENSLNLAQQRFNFTKQSFLLGDKPAIDTLESFIIIQNRQVDLEQAEVDYQNMTLFISNFLWEEDDTPANFVATALPNRLDVSKDNTFAQRLPMLLETPSFVPELQALLLKQNSLEIKERLKLEMLKPRLDVEYNLLANGLDFGNNNNSNGNENGLNALLLENYKWGVAFSFPLFLRKERGGLNLVRVEQMQTQFKYNNKRLEIQNKADAIVQQINTTYEQILIAESVVGNYQRLLQAENIKFSIGESSIFLLNAREEKLIDAQLKLLKLKAEYLKLEAKLQAALGQLQ